MGEDSVKNALRLVEEEKYDSQLLGLSALKSITSKRKISIEETCLDFLKKFISPPSPYSNTNDNESKLRLEALTVLSNLLINESVKCSFVIDNDLIQYLVI